MSTLQIVCIKCLHWGCPQPQLVATKCRSCALDTSECCLFILTTVEGNNPAGNSLNEIKSIRGKQAGTCDRRWGAVALSSRCLSALSYSFYSPGVFCCRWEPRLWNPSRVWCFQSALTAESSSCWHRFVHPWILRSARHLINSLAEQLTWADDMH